MFNSKKSLTLYECQAPLFTKKGRYANKREAEQGPFLKQQILDSSKLKDIADDNFELDENGRKFWEQVENTAGKGEIARYKQFLPFPTGLKKTYTVDTLKPGLVLERV